jgi:hypothetical protein
MLHLYYNPRGRRGKCQNCINGCPEEKKHLVMYKGCDEWTNCYGRAPLVSMKVFKNGLRELSTAELEEVAIKCGYPSLEEAIPWYIIKFGEKWYEVPVSLLEWDYSKLVRD